MTRELTRGETADLREIAKGLATERTQLIKALAGVTPYSMKTLREMKLTELRSVNRAVGNPPPPVVLRD